MKSRLTDFIPALLILTAGFSLLRNQRGEIASFQKTTSAGVMSPIPQSGRSSPASPQPPAAGHGLSPAAADARAAIFIDHVREQARPLIDKTDREALLRGARFKADRTALLLKLSAAETESLRSALEKHAGSGFASATRAWVVQNRGEEAALKLDAAETASRTATVEHDAQDAIFRLSRIVDLTPDQKDRLYSSFVRKASSTPVPDAVPSELIFSFSLKDTPSIDNPGDLARPLLTPEQLSLYDASRAQENKAISDSTGEVMNQLVPTMLSALESASKE